MPITQERMIDLINAGLDYQEALQEAERIIKREIRAFYDSNMADPKYHMDNLLLLITEAGLLKRASKSMAIIQIEQRHFRQNKHRNERRKNKLRDKRGTSGEIRSTAPLSFLEKKKVQSTIPGELLSHADQERIQFKGLSDAQRAEIEKEAERDEELQRREREYTDLQSRRDVEEELDDLMSQGIGGSTKKVDEGGAT
jgi:hypothetical protein